MEVPAAGARTARDSGWDASDYRETHGAHAHMHRAGPRAGWLVEVSRPASETLLFSNIYRLPVRVYIYVVKYHTNIPTSHGPPWHDRVKTGRSSGNG